MSNRQATFIIIIVLLATLTAHACVTNNHLQSIVELLEAGAVQETEQ